MTTTTAFSPAVLLSPDTVRQFLGGDKAAAEIRQYSPPVSTNQGRTWDNSWIDPNELYHLFSSFALTLASYLLHALCFRDLSKKTWVMSRHAMDNATVIKTRKVFEDNLLSRSINTHRLDSADYFLQPPLRIPFETHPVPTNLNFFHEDGICRGMCHWFVHLYFKTLGQFTDPEQHLRAIGEQFAKGASPEPAFLQSLNIKPEYYDLLGFTVREDETKINPAGKTVDQILREVYVRVPGVYGIYTSGHVVIYIKIDDHRQYLFEPNRGCIKLASTELFKKAMQRYFESHDNSKEILIDRYTSR